MLLAQLFRTIQDFNTNKIVIDWDQIWQNQEFQSSVLESLDIIQQSLALMHQADVAQRIDLIGHISFLTSHFDFTTTMSHDEEHFLKITHQLQNALRSIITMNDSWLATAQERYDDFLAYTDTAQKNQDESDHTKIIHFQPVLLAIGIASLIEFDQMDEDQEHSDSDESCDDDCDDEHHQEQSNITA